MIPVKSARLIAFMLPLLAACNVGYGPVQDQSGFESARLAEDGETVLLSYHRFRYRPAAGFRAFPDGGIPKYITDINTLAAYHRPSGKLTVLRREENRDWQPGQGNFTIQATNGDFALVAQGGQLRGPFALGVRYILVDFRHGKLTDLDLKADLARHDRDPGQIYLAAPDGTLVFITPSLQEAQDADLQRRPEFEPEIWARLPSGEYLKIGASHHYERVVGDDVIYWDLKTRQFHAYSLASRKTRVLPGYKTPPYVDNITHGVGISSDRKSLEFGARSDGQWSYQPLSIDLDDFR